MQEQRGARWLAHEKQQSSGANEPDAVRGPDIRRADDSPRYSITDCMSDRALAQWAEVLTTYGYQPADMVRTL